MYFCASIEAVKNIDLNEFFYVMSFTFSACDDIGKHVGEDMSQKQKKM